jgi:esterase/lipase superfamily enzyme
MGNRIAADVLNNRFARHESMLNISELLLAAPDINEDIFREQIAPGLAAIQSMHRTIYASGNDLALQASKVFHDFPRVGDTAGGVHIFPGFDTIDATAAAPILRSYGHSYIMDSQRVLADVADLLIQRRALTERRLDPRGPPPNTYWLLR